MFIAIITFLMTLIIGPVAFWVFSTVYYKHNQRLRFPASAKGAIGDTIMLPLFNARAVYDFVNLNSKLSLIVIYSAVIITLIIAIIYIYYRRFMVSRMYQTENWMNTGGKFFNGIGWYHFGYFILQVFIIIVSSILFSSDIWLWSASIGYLATAIVGHYQLKNGGLV